MASNFRAQFAFNAGLVTAKSHGRHDIEHWQRGADIMENVIPNVVGGAMNRPGSEYIGEERRIKPTVTIQSANYLTDLAGDDPPAGTPLGVLCTSTAHGLATGDTIDIITQVPSTPTPVAYLLQGVQGEVEYLTDNAFFLLYDTLPAPEPPTNNSGTFTYQKVNASKPVRVIPFERDKDASYGLWFGDGFMNVSRDGAMLIEDAFQVDQIEYTDDAVPPVLTKGTRAKIRTTADTDWKTGDEIFLETIPNAPLPTGNRKYRVEAVNLDTKKEAITGYVLEPGGYLTITISGLHSITEGEIVRVTGRPDMESLNDKDWYAELDSIQPILTELRFHIHDDGFDGKSWVDSSEDTLGGAGGFVTVMERDQFYLDGTGGDADTQVAVSPTVSASRFVSLRSPYAAEDVSTIDYSKQGDVMRLTCDGDDYEVHEVERVSDVAWTLQVNDFEPKIEPPDIELPSPVGTDIRVALTAVAVGTGEESLYSEHDIGISGTAEIQWVLALSPVRAFEYNVYTNAVGATFTQEGLGLRNVEKVGKAIFDTSVAGAPDFTKNPPEYVNPFLVKGAVGYVITAIASSSGAAITVAAVPAHAAQIHDWLVPEEVADGMGLVVNGRLVQAKLPHPVGVAIAFQRVDTGAAPAYTSGGILYPMERTNNPTCVAHYQQRAWYAGAPNNRRAVYSTKTGGYYSFGTQTPSRADDAISLEVAGLDNDAVLFLVPMKVLIALTASTVFTFQGRIEDGALTPTEHTPILQYGGGVANVKPVVVGDVIIYVARTGSSVMEIIPNSDRNDTRAFRPAELSTLVPDLLDGFEITQIGVVQKPVPIVYFTRDDGAMLGITYHREQEIFAWHTYKTKHGQYESVAGVPEGKWTGQYQVVKRRLNGKTRRFYERANDRAWLDVQDAVFTDATLKYDDPYTLETTVTSAATGAFPLAGASDSWAENDLLDMEHRDITEDGLVEGGMHNARYIVTAATATVLTIINQDLTPLDEDLFLDEDGFHRYPEVLVAHRCATTVTGLHHLAMTTVAILADGGVETPQMVSAAGTLTFGTPHSRVNPGLGYESRLRTLPADAVGGPFQHLVGRKMRTSGEVGLELHKTLGLKVGPTEAEADASAGLNLVPVSPTVGPDLPVTAFVTRPMGSGYGRGQLFIKQTDPLPFHVTAAAVDIEVEA